LPPDIAIDVVLLHLYNTELEIAITPAFLHKNQLTSQQRKIINAGLKSIKSWFDVFFTITPAAYIGFPFSIISQLVRCLTTLYRLRILDDQVWEYNYPWNTMDPILVLNQVIQNMEKVAISAKLDNSDSPEGDIFFRSAQLFRSLQPGWEAKLRTDNSLLSNISNSQNMNDISFQDSIGMEFLNNEWFMDISLPPN
jgi:hypothetical protein